jgi:hypothetical protein
VSVLERVLQCVSVIRCGFSSTKLKLNELKEKKNSWHMCVVVCLCERKWIDLRNCFDRLERRNHLTLEPDYFVLQKKRNKEIKKRLHFLHQFRKPKKQQIFVQNFSCLDWHSTFQSRRLARKLIFQLEFWKTLIDIIWWCFM